MANKTGFSTRIKVEVRLDGKPIGTIEEQPNGKFRYRPKGTRKIYSDEFGTWEACFYAIR